MHYPGSPTVPLPAALATNEGVTLVGMYVWCWRVQACVSNRASAAHAGGTKRYDALSADLRALAAVADPTLLPLPAWWLPGMTAVARVAADLAQPQGRCLLRLAAARLRDRLHRFVVRPPTIDADSALTVDVARWAGLLPDTDLHQTARSLARWTPEAFWAALQPVTTPQERVAFLAALAAGPPAACWPWDPVPAGIRQLTAADLTHASEDQVLALLTSPSADARTLALAHVVPRLSRAADTPPAAASAPTASGPSLGPRGVHP